MSSSVVITGYGASTSVGETSEALWRSVTANVSQIPSPSRARGLAPIHPHALAYSSTLEALQMAGLWDGSSLQGIDSERVGCTISASKPLLTVPVTNLERSAPLCQAPLLFHSPEVILSELQKRFGFRGETRNVVAACATGAYSAALGASWIRDGLCDVVLVGSVEPKPHPLYAAGFQQLGVLSNEECMRPFDSARSGFVFGEGAGVVVLESEESAHRRGVPIRAVLSGWALGSDTHSTIAFNSDGDLIAQVIRKALQKATLSTSDITHVNAHGTATRLNDVIEAHAIRRTFGSHTDQLYISATKSTTGHLLGAAGSVEFVLTIQSLEQQSIPPTKNLRNVDRDCALQFVQGDAQPTTINHAVSLSFGFGGPIGVLVVSHG